jgi:hypothetical protein
MCAPLGIGWDHRRSRALREGARASAISLRIASGREGRPAPRRAMLRTLHQNLAPPRKGGAFSWPRELRRNLSRTPTVLSIGTGNDISTSRSSAEQSASAAQCAVAKRPPRKNSARASMRCDCPVALRQACCLLAARFQRMPICTSIRPRAIFQLSKADSIGAIHCSCCCHVLGVLGEKSMNGAR